MIIKFKGNKGERNKKLRNERKEREKKVYSESNNLLFTLLFIHSTTIIIQIFYSSVNIVMKFVVRTFFSFPIVIFHVRSAFGSLFYFKNNDLLKICLHSIALSMYSYCCEM